VDGSVDPAAAGGHLIELSGDAEEAVFGHAVYRSPNHKLAIAANSKKVESSWFIELSVDGTTSPSSRVRWQ